LPRSTGDRGSNITLLGLFSNIVLCISKGVAGVFLNSASLVADAAHSLSDMFSDMVTLFCWKMSQKPPSRTHPLGYGKYETMGGLGVSVVLVGGAAGIGLHSWGLLLEAVGPMLETAPVWIKTLGSWSGALAQWGGHSHGAEVAHTAEGTAGLLDPNAMWFALASVLVKEWLYRATLKIAKEENSSVLEANAIHHRSDSLSSGVTFLAIGGSWLGFPILDPLGGLLVAALIGKQGFDLLWSALSELSDRGVDLDVLEGFESAMSALQGDEKLGLVEWRDLRAVKSGVSTFVDVTLVMSGRTTLDEARLVEDRVREALIEAHKGVKEVRVHFAPA
jgi:divalent metal cation (Fe/Co/Zn/Cd) transporter